MTPYFFGYGSLVNKQTHDYPDARSAKLHGWRRAWVRTAVRDLVFLSVVEDSQCSIDGLVAAVPLGIPSYAERHICVKHACFLRPRMVNSRQQEDTQ